MPQSTSTILLWDIISNKEQKSLLNVLHRLQKLSKLKKRLKLQEKQDVPIQLSKPVIWIMIAQLSF